MERLPFTSTVLMRRVTTSLSRSRRMVSTSGSSGTAPHLALGPRHVGGVLGASVGPRVAVDEHAPRHAGRGLLGVFLGPPLAHTTLGSGHEHPGPVAAGVVGAGALHVVAG